MPLREISKVSNTEKEGGWKGLINWRHLEENAVDAKELLSDAPQVPQIVTASC